MLVCLSCNHGCNKYSRICRYCGKILTIQDIPAKFLRNPPIQEVVPESLEETFTLDELLETPGNYESISGFEFLGEVSEKFCIMLFGLPGRGKSYFSLIFADQIARSAKTCYMCFEESPQHPTFTKKLMDCKLKSKKMVYHIDHAPDVDKTAYYIKKNNISNFILDSATQARWGLIELKILKDAVPGIFLFVLQSTKDGNFCGDNRFEHLCDISIESIWGVATLRKNRYGTNEQSFDIFKRVFGVNKYVQGSQQEGRSLDRSSSDANEPANNQNQPAASN